MINGTSLLSQIPLPSQKTAVQPAVASVKVGDFNIEGSDELYGEMYKDSLKLESKSFVERLKNKFVQYRMNKIAKKPAEERTPAEQAEYEANQRSLNSMV